MDTIVPASVMELNINEDGAKRAYASIKEKKAKLKDKNAMLRDTYLNDAEYAKKKKEIDDEKKKLAAIKQKLDEQPAVYALKDEIKAIKEEIEDSQLNLFGHLGALEKTGILTLEIDGKVRKIVRNYKLETE